MGGSRFNVRQRAVSGALGFLAHVRSKLNLDFTEPVLPGY